MPTALRTAQTRISMRAASSAPVRTMPALSSSSRPTIASQSCMWEVRWSNTERVRGKEVESGVGKEKVQTVDM